jgi:hypothetical protein
MSFLEMPNSAAESSADEVLTEGGSPARTESLTSIRLRDVKTGKFVAGAGLVTKRFNLRSLQGLGEATAAGVAAGFIANQLPQNRRTWRGQKKKLDKDLSVGLKKIKE